MKDSFQRATSACQFVPTVGVVCKLGNDKIDCYERSYFPGCNRSRQHFVTTQIKSSVRNRVRAAQGSAASPSRCYLVRICMHASGQILMGGDVDTTSTAACVVFSDNHISEKDTRGIGRVSQRFVQPATIMLASR